MDALAEILRVIKLASCRFICGYLACDPHLGQAFLGGLPPVIRLNIREDSSGQWLPAARYRRDKTGVPR